VSTNYIQFWDDLLDPMAVTFDGDNKQIILNPQYPVVRVKQDIYSASKRWLQRRQNSSYLPPLRGIGGDSVGGGVYAGDLYFLTNSWSILVRHQVVVTGVLYNDNVSVSTYTVQSGGGVQATVSSLAYAYNTTGAIVPSAAEVATQVWNTASALQTDQNTLGGKLATTAATVSNINVATQNILALSA
jgi:hypothetical protein